MMGTKRAKTVVEAPQPEAVVPDPAQGEAAQQLIEVCRTAKAEVMKLGRKQAPIVDAVVSCLAAGVSRLEIGQIIATEFLGLADGSRDVGARYIDLALAHTHTGKFEGVKSVQVGDEKYKSPIDALRTGKHSFRQVYLAWIAVVQGEKAVPETPRSVEEGTRATLMRAQIRYETQDEDGNPKTIRLRLVDHEDEKAPAEAWVPAVRLLIEGATVAKQVLGDTLYAQLRNRLRAVLAGRAPVVRRGPGRPRKLAA